MTAKHQKKMISKLADDYGQLKAQIKDLENLLLQLRTRIIDSGLSEIEGQLFRVTVTNVEKITIDITLLKESYPNITDEFQRATNSIVVRCNSR